MPLPGLEPAPPAGARPTYVRGPRTVRVYPARGFLHPDQKRTEIADAWQKEKDSQILWTHTHDSHDRQGAGDDGFLRKKAPKQSDPTAIRSADVPLWMRGDKLPISRLLCAFLLFLPAAQSTRCAQAFVATRLADIVVVKPPLLASSDKYARGPNAMRHATSSCPSRRRGLPQSHCQPSSSRKGSRVGAEEAAAVEAARERGA